MESDGTLWQLPGETREAFIDRIVAARPPLTDSEKTQLRAIFRTVQPAEGEREAA